MLKISFTPISQSSDAEAYFEAEAARPERHAQLGNYYEHAAPARWLTLGRDGASERGMESGHITQALRGFAPDGAMLASNAGEAGRRAATDVGIGADKTVSALLRAAELAENTTLVRALNEAFQRATAEIWRAAAALELVDAREGPQGRDSKPAAQFHVIEVSHDLSRAGDPQLHKHGLLLNAASRQDGTPATIDAKRLVSHKFMLQATGSSALARELEALGIAVEEVGPPGRGRMRVAGVPEQVVEAWSKRRAAITHASTTGVGTIPAAPGAQSTRARRMHTQAVAGATRSRKDELPSPRDLEQRHRDELAAAGTSPERLVRAVKTQAFLTPKLQRDPAEFALEHLFDQSSIASARQIRTAIAEAAAPLGWSATDILSAANRTLAGLERLGENAQGESVYTKEEALERERTLLRVALESKGQGRITRASVRAAIAKLSDDLEKPITLAAEQVAALEHASVGDAVSVVRGVAGAGKAMAMAALTDAGHRDGMRVITLAPTNRAASGLHAEAGTDGRLSIQKLRMEIEAKGSDTAGISSKTLLFIDEAGMCGMRDVSIIVEYARRKGATVLLLGDEQQFSPIDAGAPLRLLKQHLGAAELQEIRRQKTAWQRVASQHMAAGNSVRGLEAYDARGHVHVARGRDAAHDHLARDYAADLRANPASSRIVIAQTNRDVHALNEKLRQLHEAAGHLSGLAVTIPAFRRGGEDGELADLEIRAGDQLLLWSTLKSLGLTNGDRLAVRAVAEEHGEPVLAVRTEAGRDLVLRWSDLTPEDSEAPRLQHAYAVSAYASQGATVDRAFVYGGAGLDRAASYVAMTRHRADAQLYFDGDAARQELVEQGVQPTRDLVREHLIGRASESPTKTNASDFLANPVAWARIGLRHAPPVSRAAAIMDAATEDARQPGPTLPRPGEAGRRTRAAARLAAAAGQQVPSPAEEAARAARQARIAAQAAEEARKTREDLAVDPWLRRAHRVHSWFSRLRTDLHNARVERHARRAATEIARPGWLRRNLQHAPMQARQHDRRARLGMLPAGRRMADHLSLAENREWHRREYAALQDVQEPAIQAVLLRAQRQRRPFQEPDLKDLAQSLLRGRGMVPPDLVLPPPAPTPPPAPVRPPRPEPLPTPAPAAALSHLSLVGDLLSDLVAQRAALNSPHRPGRAPAGSPTWALDRRLGDLLDATRRRVLDPEQDWIRPDLANDPAWAAALGEALQASAERQGITPRDQHAAAGAARSATQKSAMSATSVQSVIRPVPTEATRSTPNHGKTQQPSKQTRSVPYRGPAM